jgi:hypothetical protein
MAPALILIPNDPDLNKKKPIASADAFQHHLAIFVQHMLNMLAASCA